MRKVILFSRFFIVLVVLTAWIGQLQALGVLFNRPLESSAEYDKMWIKSVDIDVEIQDQIAVTHVDQTFRNELGTVVEAVYIFPLPENAMITELVYWFNGERYVAEIRERQAARDDYNRKIRQYLDPALLEYLGDNLFRLSIAPINGNSDVRTEITYVELLNYDFGKVHYKFLLNTLDLSPRPLQTVTLGVETKSQTPFKSLASPSHQNSTAFRLTKISDTHYSLLFGDENFLPDRDFTLEFETVRDQVNFNVLTYSPTRADSFGEDSFYALWITPPDSISEDEIIPKSIVFTADVSSSMVGTRLRQLKVALNYFLDLLNPEDLFNIVAFGTHVDQFKPDLVPANAENIAAAHEYVFQMYSLGMTNIDKALSTALNQSYQAATSNIMIFLTDGFPTSGVTQVDSIVAHAQKNNKHGVRIFSFGISENISRPLLIRLSRENHGYPTFITADDSIAFVVNQHFTRMSKPVLADLKVDLGGLHEWDHYPKVLTDLYWGSQILQMGLYTNSGTFPVQLSGKIRGDSVSFSQVMTFADTLGGHRFVPRLWAKTKIDYLLELIEIYGETEELINQVIDLSLRFQILTSYTAFYADPNPPPTLVENENSPDMPEAFVLFQNYPNPFNSSTEIKYYLPKGDSDYPVLIRIYDIRGRLVKILVENTQSPGAYSVSWDGSDLNGLQVTTGVYFCTLQAGAFSQMRKIILLR